MSFNVDSQARQLRFRYESEMIPALRLALPRLAFRHEKHSSVEIFAEVPAIHGVPDLAAIRFDMRRLERRQSAGIRPLSSDREVRVALALERGALPLKELAASVSMSTDYLRRAVLPLMEDCGWVSIGADRSVRRHPSALWAAKRVVTIEAKLRDWKRALHQARRQQLSSDAAFIALEASACAALEPDLSAISQSGVGVISVSPQSGTSKVLVRPRAMPEEWKQVGRALISERCLDMLAEGRHEGQIYPVFGWTLPPELS